MTAVAAAEITDAGWLGAQLDAAAARYRLDRRQTLGVIWWYSTSSVLLGVAAGGMDPALDRVTLYLKPDGLVLDARSAGALPDTGKLGRRLADALAASISSVATESGAPQRALWAIATDSLANRVLWAGGGPGDARRLAAAVGAALPVPRFDSVHDRPVVRRASCCLIYHVSGIEKCASCPRQTPEERLRRLSAEG
ncbi:MAG: (2Fe-2S)-binding protein [Labedaea sp.]